MRWPRLFLVVWAILLTASAQAQTANTWGSAEVLFWWTSDGPAPPPLATTAPANSPAAIPGALGEPDTTVVLGGDDISHHLQAGGRFIVGSWLPSNPSLGLEATYLFLGKRSESDLVEVEGDAGFTNPYLTNPLFNVAPGTFFNDVNFLALPGPDNSGTAKLTASHELHSAELNGLALLVGDACRTVSLIAGYRYANVEEGLTFATSQNDDFLFFPGQFVDTIDRFKTENDFHGGQLGLRGEWKRGSWFFASTVKVALGNVREVVRIRGATTTNTGAGFVPIPVTTVPGGIYALPTNQGEFDRNRFAVLPEVSAKFGVHIGCRARLFAGYNFLYLSDVARPGDQIDGTINFTQLNVNGVPSGPLMGAARPAPRLVSSDYWAQGINLGAEVVW